MPTRQLASLLLTAMLAGCATHFVNMPLSMGASNAERRTIDVSDKSRPVIVLAISGGGSRAAALGWNVLKELRNTAYKDGAGQRRLVDDVAIVSSVSGGSTIAAYFGLNGPDALDGFEPFLVKDNVRSLLASVFNPFAGIGRALAGGSRTDLVVDLFDDELFHRRKMGELNRPGKPFIILNSTDMAGGEVFSFRPDMFDNVCSNLDEFSVATAVATSADVPILFAPVALANYNYDASGDAHRCNWLSPPPWIANRLNAQFAQYVNLPVFLSARYANDLRRGPEAFRDIRYLYLVDGGLADNAGVHSLLSTINSPQDPAGLLRLLNEGELRRLVVIVVNARSDSVPGEYVSPDRPGLVSMLGSVSSVPISSATAGATAQLNDALAQIGSFARSKGAQVYNVVIDFDQFRTRLPEQKELRDRAKAIPTSWTVSEQDRLVLQRSAVLLLHQQPCFQRLLMDLGASASYVDPAFASTGCPQQ